MGHVELLGEPGVLGYERRVLRLEPLDRGLVGRNLGLELDDPCDLGLEILAKLGDLVGVVGLGELPGEFRDLVFESLALGDQAGAVRPEGQDGDLELIRIGELPEGGVEVEEGDERHEGEGQQGVLHRNISAAPDSPRRHVVLNDTDPDWAGDLLRRSAAVAGPRGSRLLLLDRTRHPGVHPGRRHDLLGLGLGIRATVLCGRCLGGRRLGASLSSGDLGLPELSLQPGPICLELTPKRRVRSRNTSQTLVDVVELLGELPDRFHQLLVLAVANPAIDRARERVFERRDLNPCEDRVTKLSRRPLVGRSRRSLLVVATTVGSDPALSRAHGRAGTGRRGVCRDATVGILDPDDAGDDTHLLRCVRADLLHDLTIAVSNHLVIETALCRSRARDEG